LVHKNNKRDGWGYPFLADGPERLFSALADSRRVSAAVGGDIIPTGYATFLPHGGPLYKMLGVADCKWVTAEALAAATCVIRRDLPSIGPPGSGGAFRGCIRGPELEYLI